MRGVSQRRRRRWTAKACRMHGGMSRCPWTCPSPCYVRPMPTQSPRPGRPPGSGSPSPHCPRIPARWRCMAFASRLTAPSRCMSTASWCTGRSSRGPCGTVPGPRCGWCWSGMRTTRRCVKSSSAWSTPSGPRWPCPRCGWAPSRRCGCAITYANGCSRNSRECSARRSWQWAFLPCLSGSSAATKRAIYCSSIWLSPRFYGGCTSTRTCRSPMTGSPG